MPLSPVISTLGRCPAAAESDRSRAASPRWRRRNRDQRLQLSLDGACRRFQRPVARGAELEALAKDRADRAKALQDRLAERPRPATEAKRGRVAVAADRLGDEHGAVAPAIGGCAAPASARAVIERRSRPRRPPQIASGRRCVKMTAAWASHASSSAVVPSFASSAGSHRGIHDPSHERVVAVHLRADEPPGALTPACARARPASGEVGLGAERLEDRRAHRSDSAVARRPRAGRTGKLSELQITEPGLIPLAEQIEHADALAEIVVRLGAASRLRRGAGRAVAGTLPRCRCTPRAHSRLPSSPAAPRPRHLARREERLDGDQIRLHRIAGGASCARAISSAISNARGGIATPERESRLERPGRTTDTSGWSARRTRRRLRARSAGSGWPSSCCRESGGSAPACRTPRPSSRA